jgi:hypothetical protein
MRDGVLLRSNVFRPDASGTFPGLLLRTPYGKPGAGYERYVRAGYAVVTQDTRGRYASEGDYVPFTVENTGDAEDGYDAVEWVANQKWCNGSVGTIGASYNAWMQWQTAKLRPPSLVAMCAWSIPLELTEVDWPGAFKPGRRIRWWMTTIAPDLRRRHGMPGPHTPAEASEVWDEIEHGRWLGFMPWMDVKNHLPPGLAEYAEDWLQHPNRRPWKFDEVHKEVSVPNLDFSGWYDHCGGTMAHLKLMQENAQTAEARQQTKLVIGPWSHPTIGQRKIGEIDFGPQAQLDIHDLILRWFGYWLGGSQNGIDKEPPCRYFVMGSAKWKNAETWPPPMQEKTLYMGSDGQASAEGSGRLLDGIQETGSCDTYTFDPNDPVPTLWSRSLFSSPADRRKLEHRQDILYYRSEPLEQEVEVVGYPEVVLYGSSSAPDTDFFARLVDEEPDGPATEVSYGFVRARHRNSYDTEELLKPGEVTEFRIKLSAAAIQFQAGHRIRLEITSSDFPNHDRNHNTGRNDLVDTELRKAEQTIHHSPESPSRLIMPVDDS